MTESSSVQADFFTKRWLAVQQRFWGRSQWVLAVDSDVMAANLTRSLDAWLDLPQDLVLTVRVRRRSGLPCALAYASCRAERIHCCGAMHEPFS